MYPGLQTGSKSVITLNLSRIVQDWYKGIRAEEYHLIPRKPKVEFALEPIDITCYEDSQRGSLYQSLAKYLSTILERVYKYHTAYNEYLWDMYDAGLLPVYKAGFIDLNKQYLTIGLNGLNQAAEFLGLKCSDNEDYKKFCQLIFSTIKEHITNRVVSIQDLDKDEERILSFEIFPQEGYRFEVESIEIKTNEETK